MTIHELSKLELNLAGIPGFIRIIFPALKIFYNEFVLRGQILNPKGPSQWKQFMNQYNRRRKFNILEAFTFSGFSQIFGAYLVGLDIHSPWGWLVIVWGIGCGYSGMLLRDEETEDRVAAQFAEQQKEIDEIRERLGKVEQRCLMFKQTFVYHY